MGYISAELARSTASPTAQSVLANYPDACVALAQNPHLSDDLFTTLYTAKMPVPRAKAFLGSNVPSDAQFAHVLRVEARPTVLTEILSHGAPSAERLDQLIDAKAFTRAVADKIVAELNANVSLDWLRAASAKVGGRALLELWLRAPGDFTDTEIADKLAVYSTWGPIPDKRRIPALLASRPGVVGGAARSDESKVRMWAAGCRHLTLAADQLAAIDLEDHPGGLPRPVEWIDKNVFTLMALANNPVVGNDVVRRCDEYLKLTSEGDKRHSASDRLSKHPDPVTKSFETEDDMGKVAWLLSRSLPFEDRDGRPHDLPAILANPNLGTAETIHVFRRLADFTLSKESAEAANALLARGQNLTEEYGLTPRTWPEAPEPESPATRVPPSPFTEHTASYISVPASSISHSHWALTCLERELGENAEAWHFAISLLDNAFTGTVGDLAMVAAASAA